VQMDDTSLVKRNSDGTAWDIRERAFEFAVRIVKLCQTLEKRANVSRVLVTQLMKAGASVGANLEEAQGGQTKPDFVTKNAISLKEARESKYWLRVILRSYDLEIEIQKETASLRDEAHQLAAIIGSIIVNAKK
jgi:four helix bundle protein